MGWGGEASEGEDGRSLQECSTHLYWMHAGAEALPGQDDVHVLPLSVLWLCALYT